MTSSRQIMTCRRVLMTLGMFIMDRFEYLDEHGKPTGREAQEQVRQVSGNLYCW